MSKYLLLLTALALIIAPLWAEWVPVNRGEEGSAPDIQVVVADDNHAVVEVSLTGFYRDADATALWKLAIPAAATIEELGKSALPVVTGILAVPADTVKVNISDYQVLESTELQGMQVYPFQTPTTDDDNASFCKDDEHYRSAELFPSSCLTMEETGIWRNHKVAAFRLVPMQARPAEGLLVIHGKVRFVLQYEKGRADTLSAVSTEAFENMYQKIILNYTPSEVSRAKGRYVIIAEDSLASSIQKLADWRKGQGYEVGVTTLGKVGNTAQNVKDYLVQEYAKGLTYVLLVGDPAKMPLYNWGNRFPGDCWYSCLAGDDLYADVAIGRICANNAAEVNVYIDKIMAYESHQTTGNDWAVKAILVSHEQDAPGKYEGCLEELRKKTYSYKVSFQTRYGSQSSSTNSTVKNDIDAGVGTVTYRGHGSTNSWSGWNGTDFSTSNMKSLNNSVYPVFYSIACYNSQLDSSQETLAEACVKHPNGGGCAFLGATRPSYTIPNHDFCKFLFEASHIKGIANIGDVSNYANMELLKKYGVSSYAADNVKMYLWLGDPATGLHLTKLDEMDLDSRAYYKTRDEAVQNVPTHVSPKYCFVWRDGSGSTPWRPIPGTGCAHWVAHQKGISHGVGCYDGYSIRVSDVTAGKSGYGLSSARVGDIWTNTGGTHCGIIIGLGNGYVTVRHCSSGSGGVVVSNFSSGYAYR